jgi:hypothetical protein
MTRKDFIVIATALRDCYDRSLDVHTCANPQAVEEIANRISCELAKDNSRFNREHFLAVVRGQKDLHSRPSRNGVQS